MLFFPHLIVFYICSKSVMQMEFSAQRYLKVIINCDSITEIELAWHAGTQELPNLKINCLIYSSQFWNFSFTMRRTTVGFALKEVETHLILITFFAVIKLWFLLLFQVWYDKVLSVTYLSCIPQKLQYS